MGYYSDLEKSIPTLDRSKGSKRQFWEENLYIIPRFTNQINHKPAAESCRFKSYEALNFVDFYNHDSCKSTQKIIILFARIDSSTTIGFELADLVPSELSLLVILSHFCWQAKKISKEFIIGKNELWTFWQNVVFVGNACERQLLYH